MSAREGCTRCDPTPRLDGEAARIGANTRRLLAFQALHVSRAGTLPSAGADPTSGSATPRVQRGRALPRGKARSSDLDSPAPLLTSGSP